MTHWNVLDWVDGKTVRVVQASGFMPLGALGPAAMVDATTPVPEESLSTQIVNGTIQVVVDQLQLSSLLSNLKLLF